MHRVIIFFISLFSIAIAHSSPPSCAESHCIAIVDAGSTGSRLHVYAYSLDAKNNPDQIEEIFSKKVQPGFASLELNQTTINHYLEALFNNPSFNNIPVYFYATAGMRLLPYQKQHAYYDKLGQWFTSQTRWPLISAKTIKGTDEGLYGWLAVNYQLGALTSAEQPLVGVMDTGGASVQITFPITNPQSAVDDDHINITIHDQKIQLFTHSFLGLGKNEIEHQFLDFSACFSNDYPLPNNSLGFGDVSLCTKAVSPLINGVHHVDTTIKPVIESNPVKTWYAIGGLGYMVQTPPLRFPNDQFTPKQLEDQADNELCHQSWSTLTTQYPLSEYLSNACLDASYFYTLLVNGYGLSQNQLVHYFPSDKNSNDWTLGVVLHH